MSFVPLELVDEERGFGGKATQLGAALRAGLPVPPGVAIAHDAISEIVGDENEAAQTTLLHQLGGLVAVRSSAVGEDSAAASFAGQHATILGVHDAAGLRAAIAEVLASAHTDAALAYRKKLGVDGEPKMGVVVQKLVRADVAGVLFSRHPVSGADERVIEATWGLGEAVVQGLVTPDGFRMARGGAILARTLGEKDLAIRFLETGGTAEVPVPEDQIERLCLDDAMLGALEALTARCEATFGGTQDLEFAFERGVLYLLQRRAITRG